MNSVPPIKSIEDAEEIVAKYEKILEWCPELADDLIKQQIKNAKKLIALRKLDNVVSIF
jgi:hypothetical protein